MRGIASAEMRGRADQSLHRFIDRSPWKNADVRRRLAVLLAGEFEVCAWVAEEVAFPKSGQSSVGVARQYAHRRRRLLNCQLALTVFLTSPDHACPVDWRLMLPADWDHNDHNSARRVRARVPVHARSQPRWQHLLHIVDEIMVDWRLSAAPVVAHAADLQEAAALMRGLTDRRLPFFIALPSTTVVRMPASPKIIPRQNIVPTVSQVAMAYEGHGGIARTWLNTKGAAPVQLLVTRFLPVDPARSADVPHGTYLAAEWSPSLGAPVRAWVTNVGRWPLPKLLDLVSAQQRSIDELDRLVVDLGLIHFEGRSFPGWHHHVTLVSAARGYQILCGDSQEMAI